MSFAFSKSFRQAVFPMAISLSLAACSGQMVPPEDIDNGTTVSAIEPRQKADDNSYAAPEDPASRAAENANYLNTPNLAGVGDQADDNRTAETPPSQTLPRRLPKIDEDPAAADSSQAAADPSQIPEDGVNIDSALGVEQSTSLAQEEAIDIAEGNTDEPVVDGIGTDTPTEIQQPSRPLGQSVPLDQADATDEIAPPVRRREVDKETQVAFLPRFADPTEVPEAYGGLTQADRACRAEITRLGVRFRELEPINQGPACGIPHPIEVSGLAGGIRLYPAAKLNCAMTRVFAKWVRNELVPTARYRYFSGIKQIHQLSSYSCRKMNSRADNPWSEHAKGNALDVGGFILNNGKEIDVAKKGFFAFREKGLLNTVRADSCKYFNTVLGPGDAYHGNHFHFDLRYRKSGRRYCSL